MFSIPISRFVTHATLDVTPEIDHLELLADQEKVDCRAMQIVTGGGGVNAARAYARVRGESPALSAIVGQDPAGQLLHSLLDYEFGAAYHRIDSQQPARMSLLMPRESQPGSQQTYTTRPPVDVQAVLAEVQHVVTSPGWLYIGPFPANASQLVKGLLSFDGMRTYLALSRSQIADRDITLALARRATIVQLNEAELAELSGLPGDVVGGIQRLRSEGVKSLLVTSGENGLTAYYQDEWHYQPAFDVDARLQSAAGDCISGHVIAGFNCGLPFPQIMKYAAAAAAMHVAQIPQQPGWGTLAQFAAETPIRKPTPQPAARPQRAMSIGRKLAATARAMAPFIFGALVGGAASTLLG